MAQPPVAMTCDARERTRDRQGALVKKCCLPALPIAIGAYGQMGIFRL